MRWITLAGTLAGLAMVATACGGAANAGDAKDDRQGFEDAQLEYTQCLREHGVDVESSEDEGKFRIQVGGPKGGANEAGDPENDEFRAAMEACADKAPKMGEEMTPEEQAEFEDAMVEFAQCMRDHGIDMPDPEGGNGFIKIAPGSGRADPDDEEFQEAEEACSDKLPQKGNVMKEEG